MEDTQKQNRIRTAAVAPDAALDPQNDAGISPDWQATLASTLSMADVQAAGPPPLGEFQPGDPPLTTGPLSKDSPIKKSRVTRRFHNSYHRSPRQITGNRTPREP